jgi:dihydroorotate dehydrogenase
MVYERAVRPAIFRLSAADPERAHEAVMALLATVSRVPGADRLLAAACSARDPRLEQRLWGLTFPNPVGLAGGFDKDGRALRALAALGFGFIEAGTVTYRPQPGNPRPRIHRLPHADALINSMGFPNAGAAALAARLARSGRLPVPLGISIGKSKATPLPEAIDDYLASLRLVLPYADYIAINVSSPNTPGLAARINRGLLLAMERADVR